MAIWLAEPQNVNFEIMILKEIVSFGATCRMPNLARLVKGREPNAARVEEGMRRDVLAQMLVIVML